MNYLSTVSNGSLNSLLRDFDTLTNRVFGDRDQSSGLPRVDVIETEKEYQLEADLPGYSEKDVQVQVKDGLLTISSQKYEEKEGKVETLYLIKERWNSGFERSFKLPKDADQDNITAVFKNGILTLTIGRRPETQPKQITIRSE